MYDSRTTPGLFFYDNIYVIHIMYVYVCKSVVKEQEWTKIEISQTLMARKYWYRIKYNGEEVRSEKKKLWLSSTLIYRVCVCVSIISNRW